LIDYGLARFKSKDGMVKNKCGTPWYSAPEVLEGKPYTDSADVWSVGSLFYEMICGAPPFAGNSEGEVLDKMRQGRYYYHKDLRIT